MKNKYFLILLLFISIVMLFITSIYNQKYLYPVDLVYTWVDGSDENWKKEKIYWQKKLNKNDPYAASEARSRDREELLHSLRSVDEYLPWVRKIYIVTDRQIPKWLDTSNPKIEIIDHSQIFPKDALPVFNSIAIENVMVNIPNLSEHFIYSNDDCFVNKPLEKSFFFDRYGNVILYTDPEYNKMYSEAVRRNPDSIFAKLVASGYDVFLKKINLKKTDILRLSNTHNMQSYRKSSVLKMSKVFMDEIKQTTYSKFRDGSNVDVLWFSLMYDYAKDKLAVLNATKNMEQYNCKYAGIYITSNMKDFDEKDPCLFCLNDHHYLSKKMQNAHTSFLRKRFPEKSIFEK